MALTFLISTMASRVFQRESLLENLPNTIIVDQGPTENFNFLDKNKTQIKSDQKGLSRSRNLAISNCPTKWAYILDDDVDVIDSPEPSLARILKQRPNLNAIVFNHYVDHKIFRPIIRNIPFAPLILKILSVTSFEIAIDTEFIKNKNITFDERFGLGSTYAIGEEAIFLMDLVHIGGNIHFENKPFVNHPGKSTGLSYPTPQSVLARGAFIERACSKYFLFIALLYTVKAYPLYHKNFSPFQFFKLLLQGKTIFKNQDTHIQ